MFVIVVRNDFNNKAIEASYLLAAYLNSQGISHSFISSSSLFDDNAVLPFGPDGEEAMLAVVLGGDGTILRTARLIGSRGIPILGINFGHIGFLANDSEKGVIELVSQALAGELISDARSNLNIDVVCQAYDDEKDEDGAKSTFFALNEVVITRGSLGRTIKYSLDISDVHIADVSGDGVIVATATGSTAYSLAAGGPIVHPGFRGMIIQPLAPYTLTARAILTDSSDIAHFDLSDTRDGRQATLFVDGDILSFDSQVKEVFVKRGDVPTTLLYAKRDHFYSYAATFFK